MRMQFNRRTLLGSAAGWALVSPLAKAAEPVPVIGAGSSLIAPVMRGWLALVPDSLGIKVSYDPVGSGNGRTKILSGDIDFGASDEPMAPEMLATGNLIQFPLVFGGIVCAINLPGIASNQVQLTGTLLGSIYAGSVKKWNDPAIAAINPGIALPDIDIRPVSAGTPSGPMTGTTFNFTQYLLATNPDWRQKYGDTIKKRWAVGSMSATNESVVETVKILPGAIGYTSFGAARQANLTTVAMQNKAGKTVRASSASLMAATKQADWAHSAHLVANLLDLPGDDAWPIVTATYALVPKAPKHADALRAFFHFIVDEHTAPHAALASGMPPAVRRAALAMLGVAAG